MMEKYTSGSWANANNAICSPVAANGSTSSREQTFEYPDQPLICYPCRFTCPPTLPVADGFEAIPTASPSVLEEERVPLYVEALLAQLRQRRALSEAERKAANSRLRNEMLSELSVLWAMEAGLEDTAYLRSLRKSYLLKTSTGQKIEGKVVVNLKKGSSRHQVFVSEELVRRTLWTTPPTKRSDTLKRFFRRDFVFKFSTESIYTTPLSKRLRRTFRAIFSRHASQRYKQEVFDSIYIFYRRHRTLKAWLAFFRNL